MPELNVAHPVDVIGVPVGTILAYAGPLNQPVLPDNWELCDGREIRDPRSPFNGQRLPNLTDNRFLMGVDAAEDVLTTGGRNDIPADGRHGHGCTFTGYERGEINYERKRGHEDEYQMQYKAQHNGDHDHGGDNRPSYASVYYIIRVR